MYFLKATLFALFSVTCVSAAGIPAVAGEGSALRAPMPCDSTSVASTGGKLEACSIKASAPPVVNRDLEARNTTSLANPRSITVFNDTPNDIRVSVSRHGGDGGRDIFLTIVSEGSLVFTRSHEQVVWVALNGASGTAVHALLGVPGKPLHISLADEAS